MLDDTKDKARGIEKLLDREQLEEMARKDLEKTKGDGGKGKKK